MREIRTPGSARGAPGNRRPYLNRLENMKAAIKYLLISMLTISQPVIASAIGRDGRHVSFDGPGSRIKWLPVTLTAEERAIFEKRSDSPKTALDYYLLLQGEYFQRIPDDVARRITFIDRTTLSDHYLHAEYTIPRTDAGSFSITIRLFGGEEDPLIAISHQGGEKTIFHATANGPGLRVISLNMPQFWRYRGGVSGESGALVRVPDSILPELTADRVLSRYRDHYKAHLNYPTQQKTIGLEYELTGAGDLIQVTGRENFMDPAEKYVWAEFTLNGDRFVPSTSSEQDGGGQPATRSESK